MTTNRPQTTVSMQTQKWQWSTDSLGQILSISQSFSDATGIDPKVIIGKTFAEISLPIFESSVESDKKLKCYFKKCKIRKSFRNIELPINSPANGMQLIQISGVPKFGKRNKFMGYSGVGTGATISIVNNLEINLKDRVKQQSAVAEISGKALAGGDLSGLFNDTIHLIADILDVKLINIYEKVSKTDDLVIRAALGRKKGTIGLISSTIITGSLIDRIFASEKIEILQRKNAEAKRDGTIMVEKGVKTSLAIRIAGTEYPFGILAIRFKEERLLSLYEVNFIETIAYILGTAVEKSQAEEARQGKECRFELAVNGSNDGIWDADLTTNKFYYSARWRKMLGLTNKAMGDSFASWVARTHSDDQKSLRVTLAGHLKNKTPYFICEHRMLDQNGSYRWMLARGLAIRDRTGKATRIAGSLSDITESKLTEHRLLKNALYDTITNLPNRALFTDRLIQALTRSSRQPENLFALMFLDFDRFKLINDSHGHSFGDNILIKIGERLRDCVRGVDTVARLGGDEFAILLNDLDSDGAAEEVASRINHSLGQPFQHSDREVLANASIGIAFSSQGYNNPKEMIRDADIAMYQAKAEGGARHVIFEKGMHFGGFSQFELKPSLQQAIEKEQFYLAYQPVININTKKLVGFEALIRWIHPEHGVTHPRDFIPIAEKTKLIIPIGRWVIWESCRQLKKWQSTHPKLNITVSVNISARQLKDPNLINDIRGILTETRLEGRYLKVEVPESALMENPYKTSNCLNQFRDMGIQIYVDNFGTGYSSLSHLHRVPIEALKIDRSFVASMGASQENRKIVQTVITLAHCLGIIAIAEGVESKEDQNQLRKFDCDYAQGYYFSKPLSAKDATKLITLNIKPSRKK